MQRKIYVEFTTSQPKFVAMGGDDGRLTKAGMHKLRNYIHTKMQEFVFQTNLKNL